MTNRITFLTFAALPFLAACAQGPDSIAAVPMGNAFASYDCRAAAADLATERQALTVLEGQQRGAVAGDAIGVFLIGVPTSSLTGGDKAGLIGVAKGKIAALEARVAICGSEAL